MTVMTADIDARAAGRTVLSTFLETLGRRGDRVALRWRARDGEGDGWGELTWAEYADQAARIAGGLTAAGVGPGDRVILLLRNRPEFHVADIAVLAAGATPVSIYTSSSPEQIAYLAGHCRARVAIVEDAEFQASLDAVRHELPDLEHCYVVESDDWGALLAHPPVDLEASARRCRPEELATVIYTSGTTGPPKGVQITHHNVVWTVESYRALVGDVEGLRSVSYLPMAHIAERLHSHYLATASGFEVTTCPDMHEVAAYFRDVHPESIFGVPRVWEKIHAAVEALVAGDAEKAGAFHAALATSLPLQLARRERLLTAEEQATLDHLESTVLQVTRGLLGLDAVRYAVSGAAPLPVEILEWYVALGVPFSEIYGMSENTGPLTWEPWRIRPGTVGPPMPGVEIRLADDGEVLARGGLIFPGYLDDPAKTAEALDEGGWLHTGDIGRFDAAGYLAIVDRKKELLITAGGKNISPANLEAALRTIPLVGQACAVGDERKFISALLVLDPDGAKAWASGHDLDELSPAELAALPDVVAEVQAGVDRVMADFSHAEQVKRFTLLGEEWLPDSDELTPTAKLKRRNILAKYADQIEAMYLD
jgi:long-chain acyl-CoA synthetase